MAINVNKIVYYEIHQTNVNTTIFIDFMKKLNTLFQNKYFLMDNVSFHKNATCKTLLEKNNNQILYIPPYSPQFNPIEEVFSTIKSFIRQNTDDIFNSLVRISLKLNNLGFKKYYKHSFQVT